jgi:hypothetical protein
MCWSAICSRKTSFPSIKWIKLERASWQAQIMTKWPIEAVTLWRDIVTRNFMCAVASYQFFKMLGSVNQNSRWQSKFPKIMQYTLCFLTSLLNQSSSSSSACKAKICLLLITCRWDLIFYMKAFTKDCLSNSPILIGADLVLPYNQIWQPWRALQNRLYPMFTGLE